MIATLRAKRAFWRFKLCYYHHRCQYAYSGLQDDLRLFAALYWLTFRQGVRLHPQTVAVLAMIWPVVWLLFTHH